MTKAVEDEGLKEFQATPVRQQTCQLDQSRSSSRQESTGLLRVGSNGSFGTLRFLLLLAIGSTVDGGPAECCWMFLLVVPVAVECPSTDCGFTCIDAVPCGTEKRLKDHTG